MHSPRNGQELERGGRALRSGRHLHPPMQHGSRTRTLRKWLQVASALGQPLWPSATNSFGRTLPPQRKGTIPRWLRPRLITTLPTSASATRTVGPAAPRRTQNLLVERLLDRSKPSRPSTNDGRTPRGGDLDCRFGSRPRLPSRQKPGFRQALPYAIPIGAAHSALHTRAIKFTVAAQCGLRRDVLT